MQTDGFAERLPTFEKLTGALERELTNLRQAREQSDLPQVSWRSRNILELYVWCVYCSESENNARRFNDDNVRDALDISNHVPKSILKDQSITSLREWLLGRQLDAGDSVLSENYMRVATVAKELNLQAYPFLYKFLSKYAHPTALVVIGQQNDKLQADLTDMFVSLGETFCTSGIVHMRTALHAWTQTRSVEEAL